MSTSCCIVWWIPSWRFSNASPFLTERYKYLYYISLTGHFISKKNRPLVLKNFWWEFCVKNSWQQCRLSSMELLELLVWLVEFQKLSLCNGTFDLSNSPNSSILYAMARVYMRILEIYQGQHLERAPNATNQKFSEFLQTNTR